MVFCQLNNQALDNKNVKISVVKLICDVLRHLTIMTKFTMEAVIHNYQLHWTCDTTSVKIIHMIHQL